MNPGLPPALDREIERVCAELRQALIRDVLASADGEPRAGGIRRLWRAHVRRLAHLKTLHGPR